jgi:hypothetical protein
MPRLSFLTILLFILMSSAKLPAENWPNWRGPRGDGTSLETGLPTQWNGD